MDSALPKVAHAVAGRAMVCWVIDACIDAGCERIIVVVGYGRDVVQRAIEEMDTRGTVIEFSVQDEQLGTGHAVRCAEQQFGQNKHEGGASGEVLVLAGDGPLIRAATLHTLVDRHRATKASATLATSTIETPDGYGRVIRDEHNRFVQIVEEKHANNAQRSICEINPSYYCFEPGVLFSALGRVQRNSDSGEYYVTDVPALLLADGKRVEVVDAVPQEDVLSINTLEQLAHVDQILRARQDQAATVSAGDNGAGGQR